MAKNLRMMNKSMLIEAFQYAPNGVVLISPQGQWLKVNQSFCQTLGYSEEELLGFKCTEITHPDDRIQCLYHLKQLLQGKTEFAQMNKRYIHKNGSVLHVAVCLSSVHDEDGNDVYFIAHIQDITEKTYTQRLLQEYGQKYQALTKYTPLGICALDNEGRFTEVNPAYLKMTGYSAEELVYMTFRDLIPSEYLELAEERFDKALRGDLPFVDIKLKAKNGAKIHAIASSSPIIVNGETLGIYIITKDVTEQKQTEKLLRKTEKLSLVGELAAGIAHEIRNPLTSLRGFVQLFQTEETDDKKKRYYELMLSEIDRINDIVSELLVLARPTQEKYDLRCISNKLNHVVTLLEAQAHLFNVDIKREFEMDLPLISCNSNLKQVFINILKNAIDAMPNGGKVLIQAQKMNDTVVIRFIDQGIGISKDIISKIGQPFFTTKETGTGLGLMVCYRIIEHHRGSIRIDSELEKGTTVEIYLPVHQTQSNSA
jgi:two-component system sporulation sensor kinase A